MQGYLTSAPQVQISALRKPCTSERGQLTVRGTWRGFLTTSAMSSFIFLSAAGLGCARVRRGAGVEPSYKGIAGEKRMWAKRTGARGDC